MFKRFISILLILTYSTVILKSFAPIVIYALNIDYIVEYLCEQKDETENLCMGHCYLNKEAQKENEEKSSSSTSNVTQKILEVLESNNHKIDTWDLSTAVNKIQFATLNFQIIQNSIKPLLPPPKEIFC